MSDDSTSFEDLRDLEELLLHDVDQFLKEDPSSHEPLKNEILAARHKEREIEEEIKEELKMKEYLKSKIREAEYSLSGITAFLREHNETMRTFVANLSAEAKEELDQAQHMEAKEAKYLTAVLFVLCRLHALFIPSSESSAELVRVVQLDNEMYISELLEQFRLMGHAM